MDATGVAHCSGVQWSWIATGPTYTHRIPRPVLTPRQGSGHAPLRGVLATALRPAVGGGVLRRPQMASPLYRSALRARDALVLEHLPLADAVASAAARRFFPLVEREDLIQVAREALIRSAPSCRAGEPAAPYLRRCISGALQHHLRDRVRLVRVPRQVHEAGDCPLGHSSLDASSNGEPCLLDQLASPEQEAAGPADDLALEQLVDQLPAAQATALRLTVLEGLSLRAAAEQLQISAMSVQRAQKKAIESLRKLLQA
jgi:RNA polymerase sigma-B factor